MARADDDAWDLGARFGPFSLVNAALDAGGHGRACSIVAYFAGRSVAQVEAAVGVAQAGIPVLRRRLAWRRGRPALVLPEESVAACATLTPVGILTFSGADGGPAWRYGLRAEGDGVWLFAGWAHAAADGMSMLRFLRAVGAAAAGRRVAPLARSPRPPGRRGPYLAWLPGFLVGQLWRSARIAPVPTGAAGATWISISRALGDRLQGEAAAAGVGFGAWLAAAACLALCPRRGGEPRGRVQLDVPIWRDGHAALGGFGCGFAPLLLAVRLRGGDDIAGVAARISRRLRRAAERGWDRNLARFLGDDMRRHRRMARMSTSARLSRPITVSWKGRIDGLGGEDGVREVACFAASAGVHVSGHADANGLSLSLTAPQSAAWRAAVLAAIAELIGAGRGHRLLELERIGTRVAEAVG